MKDASHILVVDDEAPNRLALERILAREGHRVSLAEDAQAALEVLRTQAVDLVVSDLRMPGLDGLDLLRVVAKEFGDVEYILVTAYGSVELAVEAMREGAYDFITKPLKRHDVVRTVRKALEKRQLVAENKALRAQLAGGDDPLSPIVGRGPAMSEVLSLVRQVAPATTPVLITGESGTGKELIADAVHALSPRNRGPLIKLACAALPESLLESELFGHEQGAFTGATKARAGRFESADGGTLFLDEVGEMSQATQVKLLRVLQEGTFERLGSNQPRRADVRIVAATNRNLDEEVSEGRFREDLYYRLHVIHLHLPPLRARPEDIPLLAAHFLGRAARRNDRPIPSMGKSFLERLRAHHWPGNVRELENALERAVLLGGEVLEPEVLPHPISDTRGKAHITIPIGTQLKEVEQRLLRETLAYTNGDKRAAARILGIGERTIYRRLEDDRDELKEADDSDDRPIDDEPAQP